MKRLLLVGASGHAQSVLGVVQALGDVAVVGLIDDRSPAGSTALGLPVVGGVDDVPDVCRSLGVELAFVAIGDNFQRQRISDRIASRVPDLTFATLLHPSAVIGAGATIESGTVVMAQAVVGAASRVGKGCVVNTASCLEHEGTMADWSSLAPGAIAAGRVSIGARAFVGLGAMVLQGLSVGADTVIGAGSVVVAAIEPGVVAFGTPCRTVRPRAHDEAYL